MNFKIIKNIIVLLLMLFCAINFSFAESYNSGVETTTLQTGISLEDNVPDIFFGQWRVTSSLVNTNNPSMFKNNGVDLWNLSRENSVIKLSNPFTGANAEISLNYVNGNKIRFTKKGDYDNKKLTDVVEIELNGDKFTGTNKLLLETISDIDKSVVKSSSAMYNLRGEKISGYNVLGK